MSEELERFNIDVRSELKRWVEAFKLKNKTNGWVLTTERAIVEKAIEEFRDSQDGRVWKNV